MIFNMVGGGGAGGASIFIVNSVNERPTNVFNNTLWVNTDVDVVKYVFSDNEPSNPTEGMLWLTISNSDNVNVAAPINKDWMKFNLGIVRQYIDGVWERKFAQLYKDGIWVDVSRIFAAYIDITYPANSNCVVADSSGRVIANNTNSTSSEKTFTAIVGATGTYTVTATANDGSGNSKSKTVEITSEGQFESVNIVYWDGTIYDAGNEYTAQTGGWTISSYGASKDNNVLKVSVANTDTKSWVRTTNKISLSGVSKIEAVITAQTHSSSWSGNERCRLVVSDKEDLSNQIATVQPSNSNAQTLTLSLEGQALTATYYVGLRASAGSASNASMTCSKIQLK